MNISIPQCELLQNIPYDLFWEKVKKNGTPIIELVGDKPTHCRVTFLYQAIAPVRNVVLATYGLVSYDPRYDQLTHLPGTDIYFKSYLFPKETRTVYCFSPNDPLISLAESDLYQEKLSDMTKNWEPDPFNPSLYHLPSWLVLGDDAKDFSLLELPNAPDSSTWINRPVNLPLGEISHHTVKGTAIDSLRTIHVYQPNYPVAPNYHYPLLVFFDGDAYLEYMSAANILDNLVHAKKIPPVMALFISNPPPNPVTRHRDFACNPDYAHYIANELIPWAQANFCISQLPSDTTVIGVSLGGLCALFMGLHHADKIGKVISQSGAFWWRPNDAIEDGWLMKVAAYLPKRDVKIYLDIGLLETALTFNQGASMLSGNRHMRDVLTAKGYDLTYVEYAGGHDYICWQQTLPAALVSSITTTYR